MRKKYHFLVSFILVLSMFNSLFKTTASAVNYTGDQFVTNVELKTPSGNIVQNGDKLNLDATYDLDYTWVIPDIDNVYKKGDKLYFSIPEQFLIIDQYNFILSSGGQEVARASVLGNRETNYYIEMTFTTDYISTHSNVSGTFALKSKLNANFIKDGNNSITFPPDKDINIIVDVPKPSEPGDGEEGPPGNPGAGGGDLNAKKKSGSLVDVTLKDPETGQYTRPSKLMLWNIELGRNVMLDKVDSFDDIESIIIEDRPKNQEIIPFKDFNGAFGDAYGFEKIFYQLKWWDYGGINNQVMGMTKNSTGEYYDAFKMDILPRIKEKEAEAVNLNAEDYLRAFVVEYYTRPLDDLFLEKEYENDATITINYKSGEPDSWNLNDKLLWSSGSGTITGNIASVEITKIDTSSKTGLEGAVFDLYKLSRSGDFVIYKEGIVSDANGKVKAEKLTTGDYQFREVTAPEGYEIVNKPFDFEVKTEDLGTNQVINKGTFENSSETIEIAVKKHWDDNGNSDAKRPNTIKVQLFADGKEYDDPEILANGDDWSHTWTELPKYKDGKEIVYEVKEVGSLGNGYTSNIEKNKEGFDFYITNTRANEKTEVSGEKTWDHGSNAVGNRPTEVTIQLYADSEKVAGKTKKVTATDNWQYTFSDLPKFADGEVINYTVVEVDEFDDYTSTPNGMNVKNTYTPGQTSITVIKDWDHGNNPVANRPTKVDVTLLADGDETNQKATLTAANNWRHTFDNLDIEKDGKKIIYDVKEETITNYEETNHNQTGESVYLSNEYLDEVIKVNGVKTWDDQKNQDGKRPPDIQINLFADGVQADQHRITGAQSADTWSYEFANLQKYNKDGEEIKYTVTEEAIDVDGYTTIQTGNDFKNTFIPEKTAIKGKKVWQDKNNQDKKRPDKLVIKLLANGVDTGKSQEIATDNNEVEFEFTNLDKYKDGKEIVYTVEEVLAGSDYTQTIIQSDFTIYNSYTPETTEVNGEKIWRDDDNRDGYREDSVQIDLYGDNVIVAKRTATAADGWKYSFTNLPKKKNGVDIKYTVKEATKIPEYTTTIEGNNVINTHPIETVDIDGKKTWTDNDNQDGKRKAEVKINLFADGVKVANKEKTITAADGWKYEYKDLPKKEKGKDIVYTVKEEAVADYTTKYDGYDIENIHIPETIDVKGKKTWIDGSNQDGKRPNMIKIELFADGKTTGQTRTISSIKDEDTYEFTNLPKYKDGKLIEYTVKEDPVDEYSTTYDGNNIKNTRAPELIDIEGDKKWVDGENQDNVRPDDITVRLFADGKEIKTQKVTTDKPSDEKVAWEYKFIDLPKYRDGGIIIEYEVKEDPVDKYGTTIDEFFNIVNTHKPEEVDVKGKKVWDDASDQDGKRPNDIIVELYADGKTTGQQQTVSAEKNEQAYEFTGLPKYKKGVEIKYTVKEVSTIDEYDTKYDGFTITNKREPELVDIEGDKKWVDGENQDRIRPDKITVRLLADGKEVREQDVTIDEPSDEKIAWEYKFKDLPKYRDHGTLIEYTVTEDPVDDYGTTIDEFFNIVNTHKPEEVDVKGEKTWDDADNQDGKRPKEIVINLLADGEQIDERIVTEKDNWAYEFTNLPKYKKGDEIEYKVAEELIDEYSTTYESPQDEDVTNSYTPGVTARTVMKFWEDTDNQDGKRPDEIKVQLYADGEKLREPVVLNEENDWLDSWEDLDEMKAGKTIVYTVKEIDVPGAYEVTIDDETTPGTFVLINDYTTEILEIKGKKIWDDADNQDGKRPETIKVNLLADGEVIAAQEVSEKDKWAYEFKDLPTYRNGEKIIYTVTEDQVDDYTTEIDGVNITNKYAPGKTSATVTKTWDDDNDKNGKRPTAISVQLYADGKSIGKKETLNKANKWTKTWTDLNEMKDGKEIVYTVKETTVKDYEVSINESNIGNIILTNKYVGKIVCDPPGASLENPSGEDLVNLISENGTLLCEPAESNLLDDNDSSGNNYSANSPLEDLLDNEVDTTGIDSKNEPLNEENLPKTGSSNAKWYVFSGGVLLFISLYVLKLRRRKNYK